MRLSNILFDFCTVVKVDQKLIKICPKIKHEITFFLANLDIFIIENRRDE
jgi:hypothetical protein